MRPQLELLKRSNLAYIDTLALVELEAFDCLPRCLWALRGQLNTYFDPCDCVSGHAIDASDSLQPAIEHHGTPDIF